MRKVRASLQIIFQDPFSSLNPRMNVGDIIAEPIRNHLNLPRDEIQKPGGPAHGTRGAPYGPHAPLPP